MQTQKPIKEMIPDILKYISLMHDNHIVYNKKLLDIYEGQLLKYVEENLQHELSNESFKVARTRIPPINIIQQVVGKQAGIYAEPASRSLSVENDIDQELLRKFEDVNCIDEVFDYFTEMYCLHKYAAVELYNYEENDRSRVINATEYLPYSDNPVHPNEMTVFIKFMGKKDKLVIQTVDVNGNKLRKPQQTMMEVSVFRLYSEDEYIEIDSEGDITEGSHIVHNDGYIPFIHVSKGPRLIPVPDSDMYRMAILLPSLMADVNYMIQFCSHSTLYGIDIEMPTDMSKSPDAMWNIKSSDIEGASPQFGVISPNADTDKIWESIKNQLAMWLESKGLKTGSVGKVDGQNASSGIAKIIDESDATRVRNKLKNKLTKLESSFWKLVSENHRANADTITFSEDFKVNVEFAEESPVHDFNQSLDEEKKLFDLGLTTKKLSLARLFPNLGDSEIDDMLLKIQESKGEELNDEDIEEAKKINEEQTQEPEEVVEENPEDIDKNTVLNGAQVTAMVTVVSNIISGSLPKESGLQIIMKAFNLEKEEAEKIVGDAQVNNTVDNQEENEEEEEDGQES